MLEDLSCWCWQVRFHWSCNPGWGEKEDFPPGTSLRQGPSPGRCLGGGGWCHGEDGVESDSHLFLASTRYSMNPTRAVTVAPRATRSQKDAAPSSTAFKWLQGKREEASERGAQGRLYKHQAPWQPGVLPPPKQGSWGVPGGMDGNCGAAPGWGIQPS